MPITSCNVETLALKLKKIEVDKIKKLDENSLWKSEYFATKSENALSRKIYNDLSGLIGIEPTVSYWAFVDFICCNPDLDIKFYCELKNRGVPDVYEALMVGRGKIAGIVREELFPCYVVNQFSDITYIYVIEDKDFLKKAQRDWENDSDYFYIPKDVCMTYTEFINRVRGQVRLAILQGDIWAKEIIP